MTVRSGQRAVGSKAIGNQRLAERIFVFICLLLAVFLPAVSVAQQPTKIPQIGYLGGTSPSSLKARIEAFRRGLSDLGYSDGKNILIEPRYAEGKPDRHAALAAELVRLRVDVIVTVGADLTRSAKEATEAIPIIMAQGTDPIGNGFVASLARPGGNITGLSTLAPEISGKRLEILKEIVPRVSRVAIFGTSTRPGNTQYLREIEAAARAVKVQLQYLDVQGPKDIEVAFRAAKKARADAIVVLGGEVVNSHRIQIVHLAAANRLPTTYNASEFVEAGGLISYSASITDLHYRAATYVDKILKGAKPAELPVEQPTKFELVINLRAAKQMGLTIPPNVLARADRVIR